MFAFKPSQIIRAAPAPLGGALLDIDAMRGVAALLVVMVHTRAITWIGAHELHAKYGFPLSPGVILQYLTFPLSWGAIGVPIFFVLSGYCIHRYSAKLAVQGRMAEFSATTFLLRRFFRIYPVLLGALLVTLAADTVSSLCDPPSPKLGDLGFVSFLVNLGSLQGLLGPTYGSNDALWTLSIEVQFYLVYPLLLTAMARASLPRMIVGVCLFSLASYYLLERRGLVCFPAYYATWFFGVVIAEGEARGQLSAFFARGRGTIVKAVSGLLLALGCGVYFLSTFAAFNIWALSFALFLAGRLAAGTPFRSSFAKLMAWLGTFSYSIYIVHLPIVVLLFSLAYHTAKQESFWPFSWIIVCAIGFAYLYALALERPAIGLSHWVRDRKKNLTLS